MHRLSIARNDRGGAPAFALWPCIAVQVMISRLRGNTGAHNLAMPCLASDDSGTTPVHAMWPCLAVQVKHIVWFTLSGHGFLGNH